MDTITRGIIEAQIRIEGKPTPIYEKDGRYFIAGEPGKRYSIYVRTHRRLEVIESVDGRDVLRDKPASFSNAGMVVSSLWNNEGFRLNDDQIREFVFGTVDGSVAEQAGDPRNVGVIGIAAFSEKRRLSYFENLDTSMVYKEAGALRSAVSFSATPDMATHMGEIKADHVGHTSFERATERPEAIIEIQYRTPEWLKDYGIALDMPNAFPSAFGGDTGYSKYK